MDIIPVLDIRGGIVVHARPGERASYAPLRSRLVEGCEPRAVLAAMLNAASTVSGSPASAAYVADLDGIVQGSPQWTVLEALRDASPAPLWVDAGFASAEAVNDAASRGLVPVVGSESLCDVGTLRTLASTLGADAWVLSLDADADGARDPAGVLQHPELWPRRVIAMDLARVGSSAGPVGAWLEHCMRLADGKEWIAAGGVRDRDDLPRLCEANVAAALVATALHERTIEPA